jgi:serine/threonine-protein kinase
MVESDYSDGTKRIGAGMVRQLSGIPAEAVRAQLERVLRNPGLIHSGRLSRFLTFVVEQTLGGHGDQLKEYVIGLAVFDKDVSFDPRLDPIVRVEAGRLRAKLTRYYETDGRWDPITIEFLRGSYAPSFREAAPDLLPDPVPGNVTADSQAIAVLPFVDQSPSRDQEYFCDGMSIELINALTKVQGLRVVAWSATRPLRRQDYDLREIGKQLRVGAALEGTVRKEEEHLRISAQLVDIDSGCYIWSETYDRNLKDVFAIQEEIARAIVTSLKVQHLLNGGQQQLVKRSTESSAAYRLYLKGRYCWNRRSQQGLWDGLRNFEKALEIDPGYALAQAGVADSYSLLGNYGVLPTHLVRARAKEAAVKAVEFDANLAEAHTSLGHVTATYDWEWEAAEREFDLAIQIKESYATAHHWYAITCLMPLRRLDEALLEIERAQALDPVSTSIARDTGLVFYCRREYQRAQDQALRTLDLDPTFYEGYWLLGLTCEQRMRLPEACDALQKGAALSQSPRLIGALGHSYALMGKRREALEVVQKLATLSQRRYVSPFDTALIYMGLGEKDKAFEWLDIALAQRCYEMVWLKVDPRWDVLRSDPRCISVINAIGLETESSARER